MQQICLTPSFEKSLGRLTNREQGLVKQVPTDFMLTPDKPGHRLHKLNCRESRFASISVNRDLRIIVLKDKERLLFCYVGHHDDAYRWAERRQIEVHPITGAAQIVELEEVIREEIRYVPRKVQAPPIFVDEDNDYLLSLGVPQSWLDAVKQVDADGLYAIIDRLPEEAAEALLAIYDGKRPEPTPTLPLADLAVADPYEHPDAKRRIWVASSQEALRQALDYPWERWMVFLHPSQRDAVERNFGGPARVTGGAGTGKTVVALHRAVHLARQAQDAQVLLTTYSRPLVRHIEVGLDRLLGPSGDVRRRIHVEHLHKFAYDVAKSRPGFSFAPVRPKELDAYFEHALSIHPEVEASREFLRAEFDAVVDYWGIKDWKSYRDIQRSGRGSPLSPQRRELLWPIFESVLTQMRTSGKMTFSDLAETAQKAVEARKKPPFDYVIADEAQDFGPRELRFLLSLAPAGAQSHFFAGDTGQRIYRYPFSWLKAGVDIRGRGTRLLVNYRTTHQIKSFADQVLGRPAVADSEEQEDRSALSLLTGPKPVVLRYSSPSSESNALAQWLRDLAAEGTAPNEIGIFARTGHVLEETVEPAIAGAGLSVQALSDSAGASAEEAVTVGTLHAAKGLEFRAVALIGCSADFIPHPTALAAADDPEGEEIARARERQLFYVGCTRARDILRVSYSGAPSPFLAELEDRA